MDKNLINIDDLVRQRLGGGEEQERSGAWLRMRELLDKETPKAPVGAMNWRRLFTAASALLLIATVSVGSYELSSSYRNKSNDIAAVSTSGSQSSGSDAAVNTEIPAGTIVNNGANDNVLDNHDASTANNKNKTNKPGSSGDGTTHIKYVAANKCDKNKNIENNERIAAAINAAPASNKSEIKDVNTKGRNEPKAIAANVAGKHKQHRAGSDLTIPTANTSVAGIAKEISTPEIGSNEGTSVNKSSKPVAIAAGPSSGNAAGSSLIDNNSKEVNGGSNDETVEKLALNSHAKATPITHANTESPSVPKVATKGNKKLKGTVNKPVEKPTSSVADNKNVSESDGKAASSHKKTKINKMALSSHAPAVADVTGVDASKLVDEENASGTQKETKIAGANNGPAAKAKKSPATTNPVKKQPLAEKEEKETAATTTVTAKKTIEKMVVYQHYVKTAKNEGYYNLDTISRESIETLIEETSLASKAKGTTPSAAQKAGVGNSNAEPTAQITPAASVTEKSETGIKESTAAKKRFGTTTMENLSAAFNDMKYRIAGMQFAPGLTAGINGTFFGPNSFKGFQFGATGEFIFSENFSVLSELKYFHRINNSYSLNDNYYSYTPATTGGYTKELQLKAYSFSTLHSLEMPLTMRYHMGNFSIFAGGNLVYTFGINTDGGIVQPDHNTATNVSTPGADNAPKLQVDDFNSRFGLGYLLGISYQVAPNVQFDFRSVQSVWDNASSGGGKIVSDQLYKSPSLQFSIGYRFGGNKGEDKE